METFLKCKCLLNIFKYIFKCLFKWEIFKIFNYEYFENPNASTLRDNYRLIYNQCPRFFFLLASGSIKIETSSNDKFLNPKLK